MNAICIYKEQTTQLRKGKLHYDIFSYIITESKITKKFGEEESYCVVPQISFDITASKRKTNDCVIDNTQNHFYIANVFKLKMNQRKVIDMQNNRSNLLTKRNHILLKLS